MKNNTLLITLIALSAVAFAVNHKKSVTTSQQIDRVQENTTEAAWEMKDMVYAQKDEFILNMTAQLAKLSRDMDQLVFRIERSSDVIRAYAKPNLDALLAQIAALNKQLDQASSATESSWYSAKVDIRKSYAASRNDYQLARQWLSGKIAPESLQANHE